MDWKKITKQSYNEHAGDFAVHAKVFGGRLKGWLDRFIKELKPGSRILDLGCGSGRDAKYLIEHGFEVVGIDFSEELLKIARKNAPRAEFHVMDFEDLQFENETFDAVTAGASIIHLPKENLKDVLRKIHKVLKPGGLFFGTFRVGEGERYSIERRGNADLERFYSYFKPSELKKLFEDLSFNKISIDQNDAWMALYAKVPA
jgi:ubiquinone/menaquinone biosynthesis C-methylase UbiE